MADVQFSPLGTQSAPADWSLPASIELILKAAEATFDGTSAGVPFLPVLQVISDAGKSVGQYFTDSTVAAGASADVSFFPFVGSRTTVFTSTYDQLIQAIGPDAWWKLDELSGTVAHDSSGNGHDLGATTTAPTWAYTLGPPGQPTPLMATGQSFGGIGASSTYSPNLAGDFTVVAWYITNGPDSTGSDNIVSQGNPSGAHSGFLFGVGGTNLGLGQRFLTTIGTGASVAAFESTDKWVSGAWMNAGVVHSGTTWTMYVNGVAQATTYSGAYASTSTNFIIGPSGIHANQECYVLLVSRALNATQMSLLYTNVNP